ncbi:carbon monoxide dehydrogenase subunit G [Amorphus sp. 3PC139-8]
MDIEGSYSLSASREAVWKMLNDPEVLRACIPGCETLDAQSPTEMAAVVVTKIGPIKARFSGEVTLKDLDPPSSCRIVGEGKGGVAGFAQGEAHVRLVPEESGTRLDYTVEVQIGGKIAQLGQRLVHSTARKLSDQFFTCLAEKIAAEGLDDTGDATVAERTTVSSTT